MVKICRLTQDLARRVFAVVHTFVIFIETTQNRPLTAKV